MAEQPEALVRTFWRLVPERVTEATEHWLSVEQGDREKLPPLRRLLHTIKGEAHMLGLEAPAVLFEKAEQVVDAVARTEELPQAAGDALLGAFELFGLLGSSDGREEPGTVEATCRQLESAREILAKEVPARQAAPAPAEGPKPGAAKTSQAVAVDELQPLTGEIRRLEGERALLQPQLREIRRELQSITHKAAKAAPDLHGAMADLARRLGAVAADWSANDFMTGLLLEQVEDLVRRAAVVPLSRLEGQIHRVARGLAQTLGKKVDVRVRGDALIDAAIERRLAPALLQLVRNALDHGLEDSETRRARGKSERGAIDVQFVQLESSVRVIVEDDGGGVDLDRLRDRLLRRGEDPATLTQPRLLASIFEHGVTTRDVATPISGRGVGLDVVASEVAAVGGRVHAESTPAVGTRFVLLLPTTLQVDIAVPLRAGRLHCAIPSRVVAEVLRIEEIEATAEGPCIRVRVGEGLELVAVRSLALTLGLEGTEPHAGDAAIVLDHPSGFFALTIDAYENPRPLAAKPARDLAFESPLVRGVAPTPDGGVLFVLDVSALAEAVRASRQPSGSPAGGLHAVVAEDSPVARELLVGLLRSFGLRVSAAVDGQAALAIARRDPPDLVVTDVEMPLMGGLELAAELRNDPRLRDVPILVVSNRTDDETRNRAAGLGIRAYVAKERFSETDLRALVELCLPELVAATRSS